MVTVFQGTTHAARERVSGRSSVSTHSPKEKKKGTLFVTSFRLQVQSLQQA
jgi:hypothetical protein